MANVVNTKRQLLESYRINRLRGMFSEANLVGNPHKMGKKELIEHLMTTYSDTLPSEPVRHATTQVPKVETPVEKDVREVRDEIDALMKELTIDELRALRDRLQQSMDSPEEPVRK